MRQSEALLFIGRRIQHAPYAEDALRLVVRDIKTTLGADYVVIQRVRANRFEEGYASDAREILRFHPVSAYEQKILETETPLQVADSADPNVDAVQRGILERLEMRASLAIRLYAQERALGILFVNFAVPHDWRQDEIDFVQRVSRLISHALENKRLLDETSKQLRVQRALENAARLIGAGDEPSGALYAVADELARVFETDYVGFHLWENDELTLVAESGKTGAPKRMAVQAPQRRILQELETLVVRNRETDPIQPIQKKFLTEYDFFADIGAPLVVGGNAIGILYISQRSPRDWTDPEINLAGTFAQHIANALEHTRLFKEYKAQVRDLRALARSAHLIGTSRSPSNALPQVASELRRVLDADYAGFHLVEGDKLYVITEPGHPKAGERYPIASYHHLILDQAQRIVVHDTETDVRDPKYLENIKRYGHKAEIVVPLISRNRPLGIVFVGQNVPRHWKESEVQFVETFVQQIANVVDLVQTLNDREARVSELELLTEIHELTAMNLDRETLVQIAMHPLRNLLGADVVGLSLVQGNRLSEIWSSDGKRHPFSEMPLTPQTLRIFETREVFVYDAQNRPAFSAEGQKRIEFFGLHTFLSAPMSLASGPVGLLNLVFNSERVFTVQEKQVVQTIANQLSMAFANANLMEQQQVRLARSSKLADFGLLCNSITDSATLQREAVKRICDMMGVQGAALRFIEDDKLVQGAACGYQHTEVDRVFPVDENLTRYFQQLPLPIEDLEQHAAFSAATRNNLLAQGFRSILLLPLGMNRKFTGLLTILRDHVEAWQEVDIQYAQMIASTLALAFSHVQLEELLHERLARSRKLTEFSLYCNSVDDSALLMRGAMQQICDMAPVDAASVRLLQNGILTIGAGYGYRNPTAREYEIVPDENLKHLLDSQELLPVPDLARAHDLPKHSRERQLGEEFKSMLIVPMVGQYQVMGILTLFKRTEHKWQWLETQFARAVGNILVLALSNLQAKQDIARKNEELQGLMDSMFSGVLAADAQGAVTLWNRRAEQMTGYTASEMYGKRWDVDGPCVGMERRDDLLVLEAMTDCKPRYSLATRYFHCKDGRTLHLREVATPMYDSNGQVSGAVCAFWDRAQEQAGERAKIDFLNEVAHQVGTKLNIIVGSMPKLTGPDVDDALREQYLKLIAGTAHDLEEFQKRFNEFQLEHTQEQVRVADVDLRALVDEQVELLELREPQRKFCVGGEFDFVLADRSRLKVVVENLLDNAYKYSPPGSAITVESNCPEDQILILKIHNEGKPIPESLRDVLFERHQRGDMSVPGSGLGLWLVRTKLHEMGGDIDYTSNSKEGTTFIVTLPRPSHHLEMPGTEKKD